MTASDPTPQVGELLPARPAAVAGLRSCPLGDGLLLHDPRHEELLVLNHSARWVFESCDGKTPTDDIVAGLVGTVAAPDVAGEVRSTLLDLVHRDLLVSGDEPGAGPVQAVAPEPGDDPAVRAAAGDHVVACLERRVAIGASGDAAARLDPLLEALTHPAPPGGDLELVHARCTIEPVGDGRWRSSEDGAPLQRSGCLDVVVQHLLWHLNHQAVTTARRGLLLHAGAVAGPRGAVLLAGDPDAGKSTTVAAAMGAGLHYLTDEAAPLLSGELLAVAPYPKPLTLDRSSVELLAARGAVATPPPEGRVLPVPPSEVGVGEVASHAVPVVAVAFPDRQVSGAPEQLDPWQAARRLGPCAFNLRRGGTPALELLAQLAETVPCTTLPTADLDEAVAVLRSLVGAPPPVDPEPAGEGEGHRR